MTALLVRPIDYQKHLVDPGFAKIALNLMLACFGSRNGHLDFAAGLAGRIVERLDQENTKMMLARVERQIAWQQKT